jgi:hypothetical protein
MDELEQLLPNGTLYFVEGGGQQQQDPNNHLDWGDGFDTNAGIISRNGWSGGHQLDHCMSCLWAFHLCMDSCTITASSMPGLD